MKRVLSIVRASLVVIVGWGVATSATGISPHLASAQAAITPTQPSEEAELTPWEQSPEVKDLLRGTFVPDPGEPAGAVKAYLATEEKVRKARRRIEVGKLPEEPAFNPEHLLNEALIVRRRSTALYPTSRHAWEGVGDVCWLKYKRRLKSADLREAVDAYERAAELLMLQGAGGVAGRDFFDIAGNIAKGRVALSDHASLDAFFQKLKGTEFWKVGRASYAMALGALNDPRADQIFREVLVSVPPGSTLGVYVDYLMDQRRYQEALEVFDRRDPATLGLAERALRSAILERLGRRAEARAGYRPFLDAAKSSPFGPSPLPERFRIPGSALQKGLKFRPNADTLPKPQET